MIRKKKLLALIFALFFVMPMGAFLVSYLLVVWTSPDAVLLDYLGAWGAELAGMAWMIHMLATVSYMGPIYALAPQYFEHSKLVGLVPYPAAFLFGVIFYLFLSLAIAGVLGCFGIERKNSASWLLRCIKMKRK